MPPSAPLAVAEAQADALVADLRRGQAEPKQILTRLKATTRPYFTWAAAWSSLQGRLVRDPEDEPTQQALAVLRAMEPEVSDLDGRMLASGGTEVSPEVA